MLRFLIAACLCASQASALSCAPPNFGEAFNRAAAAEEVYSLMYGRFQEAGPIPEYVRGEPREVVLAFVGKQLGRSGFGETMTLPVIVKTECHSAWCGQLPALGDQTMAFLEQVGSDLVLTSHLCQRDFMANPSLGQISAIRACMNALECGTDEIKAFELK